MEATGGIYRIQVPVDHCRRAPSVDDSRKTRHACDGYPTLAPSACITPHPRLRKVKLLFVRPEEVVIGRVGLELSLTHGAGGGRNCSTGSVQTLDEGGLEQEVAARGPLRVSD
jgi:hypothetical protein